MSDVNPFAGIGDVKMRGPRNPYLRKAGDYLVEINLFKGWMSTHPNSKGQFQTCVESTVLEVLLDLTEDGNPHKVGERTSYLNLLERNRDDSFTQKGQYAMERVKNFAAAALQAEDEAEVTAEAVHALILPGEVAGVPYGAGEALTGVRMIVRVRGGNAWTDDDGNLREGFPFYSWEPAPEE